MSNDPLDPLRDTARLAQLKASGLLDSPPDAGFDRLTRMATRFLNVPVALVSLVDDQRQFFKSCTGLHEPWASRRETPLTHSFCQHVVTTGEPLAIADARVDPRAEGNLAIPEIGVVAYLGIPITINGHVLGSFCVIDGKPREWTVDDVASMVDLTQSVVNEIRLRADANEGIRLRSEAEDSKSRLKHLLSVGSIATWTWDITADRLVADENLARFFNVSHEDAEGGKIATYTRVIHPLDFDRVNHAIAAAIRSGSHYDAEYRVLTPDGGIRWVNARGVVKRDAGGAAISLDGVVIDTTERRKAEETLRQKETFQRQIFESVRDFSIFTTDLTGDITSWNQGAENVFGYHESEAIGQPAAMVFTPEDQAAGIPEHEMRMAASTGCGTDERWHIRRDGSRFFASGTVRPLFDEGMTLIGFTKVARDITASMTVQETIRRNEERYRALFDSMDEGFCILQVKFDDADIPIDYRFLEINPAFERLIRLEGAEGRWVSEIMPGVTREWHERYGRIVKTGVGERFEMTEPTLEGRSFAVYAFRTGHPSEHRVAVLFNDVTARKHAEDAIRRSEAQFRMIADNITQLAWTCDNLGNVTWYNRRWLDYTGLSFEVMKGWDWSKVQHPDHLERVIAKVQQSSKSGEPWEDTFPLRGKDGRYRWFLSQAVPIRDERGEIVRWFGTNTDVTAQREAEQDLREADRRKNEFLAMLAHELRNPLGAISSGIRLAESEQTPETLAEVRGIIQHQVGHLRHLIDDLLDVSRITQSKVELRKQTVELTAISRRAVELARPQIDDKRHRLTLTTPGEPVLFEADPTRVEQMLSNLLTNAAKYSEPERAIELSATVEADEVVFRVRDQGFGIAEEMLPKIFGLFTQVDATLDRARGGLGIGLTLVKSLAEMHGGSISATSKGKDRGSEFILRLPIGHPAPLASPPTASAQPSAIPTESLPDQLRILIIDDNRDTARMTSRLLSRQGHAMMAAHDGYDGIEAATAFEPNVILLDIGLPGLNGYEVAATLRDHECCRDSVIIAVSGYGETAARERSKEVGIDYHLTKPLDFDELDAILREPRR